MESQGTAVVTCDTCGMFIFLPRHLGSYTCAKCKLVALLEEKIQRLEDRLFHQQEIHQIEARWDTPEQWIHSKEQQGQTSEEAPSLITLEEEPTDEPLVPLDELSLITLDEIQEELHQQIEDLSPNSVDQGQGDQQDTADSLLVLGDSIIRSTERWICEGRDDRMVTCLPGAKVADITRKLDSLMDRNRKEPLVMVHVGTNDVGKAKRAVLEAKFRLLGRRLKARTSKVAFSEVLPVPRAGPARQAEIRSLNAWMRRWCREEGFTFIRNWRTFWDKPNLFKRDGLHLNHDGTRLLGLKFKKAAEQILN